MKPYPLRKQRGSCPIALVVTVVMTLPGLQACVSATKPLQAGEETPSSLSSPVGDGNSSPQVLAGATPATAAAGKSLPAITKGQRTYHIGNSLTDALNDWLEPLAKNAGLSHQYLRSTIPGAPTDWNWEHPGEALGEEDYRVVFNTQAPIDHLFIQPFAPHDRTIENEAEYSNRFYQLARQKSPNVQLWLYAQWPDRTFDDSWSQAKESAAGLGLTPAKTWKQAARNQLVYHEAVRQRLDDLNKGTPVLIVPVGLAMVQLKQAIAAGKVPGMKDFFAENLTDEIHLTPKGAYLVALVHFACIYRRNPKGLSFANTGLTAAQAAIYQDIAWDTVLGYRWSGVVSR